jgi:hypothetical protein
MNSTKIQKYLNTLEQKLDRELQTTGEARQIHDLLEDDMLPLLRLVVGDVATVVVALEEHEEAIGELQEVVSATQSVLIPEHAEQLKSYIEETNSLLGSMLEQGKSMGLPLAPVENHIAKGKALIEFIDAVTVDPDSDDDDSQATVN